jgi:hypothetical protein
VRFWGLPPWGAGASPPVSGRRAGSAAVGDRGCMLPCPVMEPGPASSTRILTGAFPTATSVATIETTQSTAAATHSGSRQPNRRSSEGAAVSLLSRLFIPHASSSKESQAGQGLPRLLVFYSKVDRTDALISQFRPAQSKHQTNRFGRCRCTNQPVRSVRGALWRQSRQRVSGPLRSALALPCFGLDSREGERSRERA